MTASTPLVQSQFPHAVCSGSFVYETFEHVNDMQIVGFQTFYPTLIITHDRRTFYSFQSLAITFDFERYMPHYFVLFAEAVKA